MLLFTVICALLLDIVLGELKRYHPLVGFGFVAKKVERFLNRDQWPQSWRFCSGFLSWLMIVLLPVLLLVLFLSFVFDLILQSQMQPLPLFDISVVWVSTFIDVVVLYFTLGYTSLRQHAMAVFDPLICGDLAKARHKVSMIVSRDAQSLDESGVRKAAIESVLENGSDAIFAPVFWFCIGGLPAVLIYRLTNTLDAMWGYKTKRFLFFGRFSARMDDILNWVPARIVGFSYAVLGKTRAALHCWQQQARFLDSPNAGVVMTAGAGALDITLGGDSYYQGKLKQKPVFGCGSLPNNKDIARSIRLIDKTLLLWLLSLMTFQIVNFYVQ